jgi:hypothetical protein
MATWKQIREAIQAAIVTASGLNADRVIWAHPDANAPGLGYITMHLGLSSVVGQDGIRATTDLGRAAGSEIALDVLGTREVTLEIQVFRATTVSAGGSAVDALETAEAIRTSFTLPSVRDALGAVGFTPFDPMDINYLPDIPSVNFIGRATFDTRCYMPAPAIVEYVGYIASIEGTLTTTGGVQSPDVRVLDLP